MYTTTAVIPSKLAMVRVTWLTWVLYAMFLRDLNHFRMGPSALPVIPDYMRSEPEYGVTLLILKESIHDWEQLFVPAINAILLCINWKNVIPPRRQPVYPRGSYIQEDLAIFRTIMNTAMGVQTKTRRHKSKAVSVVTEVD